jgi:hypothetical protein
MVSVQYEAYQLLICAKCYVFSYLQKHDFLYLIILRYDIPKGKTKLPKFQIELALAKIQVYIYLFGLNGLP